MLGKVLALDRSLALPALSGLSATQQKEVAAMLKQAQQGGVKVEKAAKTGADETKKKEKKSPPSGSNKKKEQPKLGEKTAAKGRVVWRFGGSMCFGVLLAGSETKTHCYARTHKGNTKTLAKGKDYWWMQA